MPEGSLLNSGTEVECPECDYETVAFADPIPRCPDCDIQLREARIAEAIREDRRERGHQSVFGHHLSEYFEGDEVTITGIDIHGETGGGSYSGSVEFIAHPEDEKRTPRGPYNSLQDFGTPPLDDFEGNADSYEFGGASEGSASNTFRDRLIEYLLGAGLTLSLFGVASMLAEYIPATAAFVVVLLVAVAGAAGFNLWMDSQSR
jgi:hypothetical protein